MQHVEPSCVQSCLERIQHLKAVTPDLGSEFKWLTTFAKRLCVFVVVVVLQQSVCAVDAIRDKFLSDEVIVLVPGTYLTGFVDG